MQWFHTQLEHMMMCEVACTDATKQASSTPRSDNVHAQVHISPLYPISWNVGMDRATCSKGLLVQRREITIPPCSLYPRMYLASVYLTLPLLNQSV